MRRLGYTDVVVGIFHTLALFIALNAAAWLALRALPQDPVTLFFDGRPFGTVYPGKGQGEVRELLAETWGRRVGYKPFAVSREAAFQGRYVNVARQGYRLSRDQGSWPPDPHSLNVFVFGGSTTFGYGVADSETLVSGLQAHLAPHFAAQRVACYNFGSGGYFSSQERIVFEELLVGGVVPRVAVFVDGMNDLSFDMPLHSESLREYVNSPTATSLATLFRELPLVLLVERLKARRVAPRGAKELAAVYGDPAALDGRLDRYSANRRLISATAAAWNVRVLFVWQPVPTYHYDLKYHLLGRSDFEHVNFAGFGYKRMAERLRGASPGPDFLWLADMQSGVREPLYVDRVHYTAEMNDRIGEAIADTVVARGLVP